MNTKALTRVFEHAKFIDSLDFNGGIRFFTALQGSQNYHLDDDESDIDTKSLIIPTINSVLFDKNHLSTTYEVPPTNEHADVKDIRDMFDCFRKQNINFLEILFTPYVDIEIPFINFYDELFQRREEIAHYNPYQAVTTMYGHLLQKEKAFNHPCPSAQEKIDSLGYDPKQLHHMLRIKDFLIKYVNNYSYEDCLIPDYPEDLIAIKRGSLSYEYADVLKEDTRKWADEFVQKWLPKMDNTPNQKLNLWMNYFVTNIFFAAQEVS